MRAARVWATILAASIVVACPPAHAAIGGGLETPLAAEVEAFATASFTVAMPGSFEAERTRTSEPVRTDTPPPQVALVPEATTWAMMLAGIVAVAIIVHRRARREERA